MQQEEGREGGRYARSRVQEVEVGRGDAFHSDRHLSAASPGLAVVNEESIDTAPGSSNVGRIPLLQAASPQPSRYSGSVECSSATFSLRSP
jgi:hypothetical protein